MEYLNCFHLLNLKEFDFIFDFKTYLVSSNEVYFNESFNKMVESSTNLINAYNVAEVKDISINLISTSLLNYNISTNHPYLKIKNYQEKYSKVLSIISQNIKINKLSLLWIREYDSDSRFLAKNRALEFFRIFE